jgi:hypothetical protein
VCLVDGRLAVFGEVLEEVLDEALAGDLFCQLGEGRSLHAFVDLSRVFIRSKDQLPDRIIHKRCEIRNTD